MSIDPARLAARASQVRDFEKNLGAASHHDVERAVLVLHELAKAEFDDNERERAAARDADNDRLSARHAEVRARRDEFRASKQSAIAHDCREELAAVVRKFAAGKDPRGTAATAISCMRRFATRIRHELSGELAIDHVAAIFADAQGALASIADSAWIGGGDFGERARFSATMREILREDAVPGQARGAELVGALESLVERFVASSKYPDTEVGRAMLQNASVHALNVERSRVIRERTHALQAAADLEAARMQREEPARFARLQPKMTIFR